MLDSSVVVGMNSMRSGTHETTGVPVVMAGSCGGYFKTGRSLALPAGTPNNGLLVALCNAMGAPDDVRRSELRRRADGPQGLTRAKGPGELDESSKALAVVPLIAGVLSAGALAACTGDPSAIRRTAGGRDANRVRRSGEARPYRQHQTDRCPPRARERS